jgi:hypothetical protein
MSAASVGSHQSGRIHAHTPKKLTAMTILFIAIAAMDAGTNAVWIFNQGGVMENESIVKKINKCFENYRENEWIYDSFFAKLAGELSEVTKIPKQAIEDDIFRSSATLMHAGCALKPEGRDRLSEKLIARLADIQVNLHPWLDAPNKDGFWRMKGVHGKQQICESVRFVNFASRIWWGSDHWHIDTIKHIVRGAKFQFLRSDSDDSEPSAQPTAQQPDQDHENLDLAVWLATGGVVRGLNDLTHNGPHLYHAMDGRLWLTDGPKERLWQPTKNWAQLGPLIERFGVSLRCIRKANEKEPGMWFASIGHPNFPGSTYGDKEASIAACRAIAATCKPEAPNE